MFKRTTRMIRKTKTYTKKTEKHKVSTVQVN